MAAFGHLILAGKSERQTDILQLHQIDVARRIGRNPLQHIEEFFPAPSLPVKRDEQRLLSPFALTAPGSAQYGLVNRRAQHVARRENGFGRYAGGARALLIFPHLLEGLASQARDVAVAQGGAQAAHQNEQRTRRLQQGVEAGG